MSGDSFDVSATSLTAFQVTVARIFFGLPASERFLLAGGAAMLAQRLSDRPTQDLDFFTHPPDDVTVARDSFEAALSEHGWAVERITDTATFCRLVVHGPDELVVDLAVDSAPGRSATASFVGPTFAPEELAGRKMLALFDRAAPRDFVDVLLLARKYSKEELLTEASRLDAGFTRRLFAAQIDLLKRYADDDLPIAADEVPRLRSFFVTWQRELLR
jgi:hypothetical protein